MDSSSKDTTSNENLDKNSSTKTSSETNSDIISFINNIDNTENVHSGMTKFL